ncbi:MAG: tyrosine--tRNA ligase [Candidatus Omnitrophica bacterium]|nr:tyrosine--tRNA ligase [Candidatus Omnitrophota bacterium]
MIEKDINKQLAVIKRGAVDIHSEGELRDKISRSIKEDTPLIIKAGFDPTAPDIHLGHTVLLRKLRAFQELGHTVVFLIGDFTARIGDPTGRSEKRKQLAPDEVQANARTYTKQVSRILDLDRLRVVFNSEWFEKMSVVDVLKLTTHATVSQMLARADFKKRLTGNEHISLLEFMYPLLQGYDSVVLKADVELGGTDQIFNLLVGRDLQADFSLEQQVVITMPLLEGTDGVQKMSKSYANYVGIDDTPSEMFGKLMSISDEMMAKYYELLTDEDCASLGSLHPREAKMRLASRIIADYHSQEAARLARREFERVFSRKELPRDIPEYASGGSETVIAVLVGSSLVKSGNEARRLIKQQAVYFNDSLVASDSFILERPGVLKVGSRRFLKVVIK